MRNQAYEQWKKKIILTGRQKRVPVLGQYELTPACNLDCKMCYVHNADSNRLRDRELSTEQWKRIFDEAYDCGLMFATLTGGECLLRKDFKELYLHLYNKRVMVTVLTNATLINEEYVAFFKEYKPDVIQISLYGSNEEGYRNVTGHEGYKKTTWAIRALMDAGIDVKVAVTPSSYMKDDYINTHRIVKEQGFCTTFAELRLIPKRGNSDESSHYLTSEEIIRLSKERAELFWKLEPVDNVPEIGGPMTSKPVKGMTCNAGNCLAYVTWDGKMYPCGNALLGDASLLEMSYAEAWEATKAAADTVLQGAECEGCAYKKACPLCPVLRLKGLDSGHCNPEVCEVTRKLVADGVLKLDVRDNEDIEHG